MKKSMKKYLILSLVVMAILVTTIFVTSASNATFVCSIEGHKNANTTLVIEPASCNKDRIRHYYCNAQVTENGVTKSCNKYLGYIVDNDTALEHKYESKFVNVNGEYYKAQEVCKNCKNEKDLAGRYHKVSFVNCCDTKTLYNNGYTKLVTEWQETVVFEDYYKEGDDIKNISAKRAADYDYRSYSLYGWTYDKSVAGPEVTGLDYSLYSKEFKIAENNNVADHTVYAVFGPSPKVNGVDPNTYVVSFYSEGRILSGTLPKIYVDHGKGIQIPENYKHKKQEDATYRYEFSHWAVQGHSNVVVANGTKIYDAINLEAVYIANPKVYLFKYCYSDGTAIIDKNGNEVEDFVSPGKDDYEGPVNGLRMNRFASDYPALYSNATASAEELRRTEYKFTGKWIVMNGQAAGREINLSNIDLSNMLDIVSSSGQPILLEPKYTELERLYPLAIKVGFAEDIDPERLPTEATIQITDASNNLVLTKTITREATDAYFLYTAKVPYTDKNYRVSIVSGAYAGSSETKYHDSLDIYEDNGPGFGGVNFDMERKGKDACNCFCHSLIKPIWIKVLNFVYSLFGKKIVCCDDLFAENGHLLNYNA